MKLYVLFVLREGENSPEAYAVADEYTMEINPDYMEGQVDRIKGWSDYDRHEIIEVKVPDAPILEPFKRNRIKVDGTVEQEGK